MRTRRGADALFSRTRTRILSALLMRPSRSWYLTDLALHLGSPKTSLQRELANLEGAGIIQRRTVGRQVHYQANPSCPFLPELQGLLAKTAGLADVIADALKRVRSKVVLAFVYGSLARGEEISESDVDLMVIGHTGLAEMAPALRKARERLGREVNPTLFTPDEFANQAAEKGFIRAVLDRPKLFVVGDDDVLEDLAGSAARGTREGDSRRGRRLEGARRPSDRGRVG